ncbi:ubiquitin-like autophagy protein Apg12-domain-containing protein [Mycena galopus ATCC 62051]|nr:ubiquitin-like autophagy protein Apg12-domain-containing protein [Mycena galopus ATCC 62051]
MSTDPRSLDPQLLFSTDLPQTGPDKAALSALETHVANASGASKAHVIMHFKAVGATPVLKQKVMKLSAGSHFQAVTRNLKKLLGMKQGDPLFTYINSSFAPAPDEVLGNLYNSFGTQVGEMRQLIVYYSTTPAWG